MVGVAGKFAIHPVNVRFAVQLPDRKSTFAGETMTAMNRDDHLLLKQRHHVGALIGLFARQRVDDDLEVAGKQTIPQLPGVCIAQTQFKPVMPCLQSRDSSTISSGDIVLMIPSLRGTRLS